MDGFTVRLMDWRTDRPMYGLENQLESNLIDTRCVLICDALTYRAWLMIVSSFAICVVTIMTFLSVLHTLVKPNCTFVCQSLVKFRLFCLLKDEKIRPDTRQSSRGWLGRSSNSKTAWNSKMWRTNGPTDGPTDGLTRQGVVACPRLKNGFIRKYGM